MARININFTGSWRLFVGVGAVTADVSSIEEAREYIETNYGPAYKDKLVSMGVNRQLSIWQSSNVLLNGKNVKQMDDTFKLKDGDKLDLLLAVAGG
ncbi:MAG: MoaD/ThiS family protein [Dehalococcoidia bacterium]|jgi:molybdopterin converting factor small subunit